MNEEYADPSANTAQFQAFAKRDEPPPPARPFPMVPVVGAVAAVVLIGIVIIAFAVS
jgi:hypothetical protein